MSEPLVKGQLEQAWKYVESRINKKLLSEAKKAKEDAAEAYQDYCDKCEELDGLYEKLRDALNAAYMKGYERSQTEDQQRDYIDGDIERIMDDYFPED